MLQGGSIVQLEEFLQQLYVVIIYCICGRESRVCGMVHSGRINFPMAVWREKRSLDGKEQ